MGAGLQGFRGFQGSTGSQGNQASIRENQNTFDYEFYNLKNIDVEKVFHADDRDIWYDHWIRYGIQENRQHRFWTKTVGYQGSQGSQGGFQGFTGFQGPAGPQGDQGFQANIGIQVPGNAGFKGVQGFDGFTGAMSGQQGNQGNVGFQGFVSATAGAQGDQGPQGYIGSQIGGYNGDQGNQANIGFQISGFQGRTGFQGNVSGVQGDQGFQGFQGNGAQGFQAFKGFQGNQSNDIGNQGYQGIQILGIQGYRGNRGYDGFMGDQGNQGEQHAHPAYIGNQGEQGNVGLQTFTGFQGLQANRGFQGFAGDIGSQGNQGDQGNQGFTNTSGVQGAQGNQGITGLQGFQGLQGIQGNQGFTGIVGLQGLQGIQGLQSNQGLQGNQGFQGFEQAGIYVDIANTNLVLSSYNTADIVSETIYKTDFANMLKKTAVGTGVGDILEPISANYNYVMATSSSGYTYVGGTIDLGTNGTANVAKDFSGNTVTAGNIYSVFVACLDSTGTQKFFKTAYGTGTGTGTTRLQGIAIDTATEMAYIFGTLAIQSGSYYIDFSGATVTITNQNTNDCFVSALNTTGTQQFFKVSTNTASGANINNRVMYYSQTLQSMYVIFNVTFGTARDFDGNTVTGYGSYDVVFAKLSSTGTQTFYKLSGSTGDDRVGDSVYAIYEDTASNIIISGNILALANLKDFNATTVSSGSTISGAVFLASFNSVGTQNFYGICGSTGTAVGTTQLTQIVTDSSSNIYVAGIIRVGTNGTGAAAKDFVGNLITGAAINVTAQQDTFVAALNSAGTQTYFKVGPYVPTTNPSMPVMLLAGDFVYIYSSTQITALSGQIVYNFDGTTLAAYTSATGTEPFFAKVSTTDGTVSFFKHAGSVTQASNNTSNCTNYCVYDSDSQNFYMLGMIGTDTTTFDFSGATVTGNGLLDIFFSSLNTIGTQNFFKMSGGGGDDFIPYNVNVGTDFGVFQSGIVMTTDKRIYVAGTIDFGTGGTGNAVKDFNGSLQTGYGGTSSNLMLAGFDTSGNQLMYKFAGTVSTGSLALARNITSWTLNNKSYVNIFGLVLPASAFKDLDGNTIASGSTTDIVTCYVIMTEGAVKTPIGVATAQTSGGSTNVLMLGEIAETGTIAKTFYYFDGNTGITTTTNRFRTGFSPRDGTLSFRSQDTSI